MLQTRSRLTSVVLGLALVPFGWSTARAEPAAPGASPPAPRLFGAWAVNSVLTAQLAERERGDAMPGRHSGGHGHDGGGGRPRGEGGFRTTGQSCERGGGGATIAGLIFSSTPDGVVLLTDDRGQERRFAPGAAPALDGAVTRPDTPEYELWRQRIAGQFVALGRC